MRGSSQLRIGMGGAVLGFDLETLVTISRTFGYDTNAFLHLFHHAERGMMAGRYTHGNRNDEKHLDPTGGDRRG